MIDEELYKIASDELNSDDRKPDVWARACALASNDHDEARFLYTNLRVEEMLNKDGKKRTFSTNRHKAGDLSSSDDLDTLELSLEDGATAAPASRPTGITDSDAPLPIDDLLGYDADDTNAPSSTSGNAQAPSSSEADIESWSGLASLAQTNASSAGPLSNLTGNAVRSTQSGDQKEMSEFIDADIIAAANANASAELQSPESQRTARLSENLERQFNDMEDRPEDQYSELSLKEQKKAPSTPLAENADMPQVHEASSLQSQPDAPQTRVDGQDSVRTDYADSDILDEDIADFGSELDAGGGRSFMVFSRNGALKAIKRGVSWPALLFTFPWLLSKAMFGTALIYGCLWLVSLAGLYITANQWMAAGADATLMLKLWTVGFGLLALVGLVIIPFRYGNAWVADKLQNRGFKFESAVSARNKQGAMNRLLNYID